MTISLLTGVMNPKKVVLDLELTKPDMFTLKNVTVCLAKLECFMREKTRTKFSIHCSLKMKVFLFETN